MTKSRFLTILILLTFLFACETTSAATTAPTTTATTTSGYVLIDDSFALVDGVRLYGDLDGLRFDKLTFEDNLNDFMCVISSITFDVLLRRLEVSIAIGDSDWQGFTYVAEIQRADETGARTQYTFTKSGTSSAHTFVYDAFSGDGTYRFLIGKTTGTGVSGLSAMAVIGFDLDISGMDAHKRVTGPVILLGTYDELQRANPDVADGRTRTEATIAFGDPDAAVTSITLEVRDADSEELVSETVIAAAPHRGEDGVVRIDDALLDGLYPGVEYLLTARIDGNDGTRDFTDRVLVRKAFTTDVYRDTVEAKHGIYAHVRRGEVTAEGYDYTIELTDDGVVSIRGMEHPIPFVTRIRDGVGGTVLYEEEIEATGTIAFSVPNAFLGVDAVISVESADGRLVLCRSPIAFDAPTVWIVLSGSGSGRTLSIDWAENDGDIVSGYIELSDYATQTVLQTIPLSEWGSGHAEIALAGGLDAFDGIIARIHYEYDAFGGRERVVFDDIVD